MYNFYEKEEKEGRETKQKNSSKKPLGTEVSSGGVGGG